MASPALTQVLGSTRRWTITARTTRGAVVTEFIPSDSLSAVVWAGDDQGPLFEPDVVWVDAEAGELSLTVTAAMIADLAPGRYRLQVTCTPPSDGQPRMLLDSSLELLPTVGISTPLPVYATFEDLLDYCPHVGRLINDDTDQAGFAEQRARAREWFDDRLVRHYHPMPHRTRRMSDIGGTGTGPYMTFSPPPEGASIPSDDELRAMLDADGLVITDQIRECVSHKAAAIIYRSSTAGTYRDDAATHEGAANRLWWEIVPEVKSDPELDAPDLRIGRDVTFLT